VVEARGYERVAQQTTTEQNALRGRIADLADDLARLHARVDPEPGGYLEFLIGQLHGHAESLYLLTTPTAGELAACTSPGSDQAAAAALELVDGRHAAFMRRLQPRKKAA
jgi:hypothetical protein